MIARTHNSQTQNAIALFFASALVIVVLFVANYPQSEKLQIDTDASVVVKKNFFFRDLPNGVVGVVSADSGMLMAEIEGEAGFVRGILRALARERRIRQISSDEPFELTSHADGRLTLIDTATNSRIDLEAFGKDNAAVFAAFLTSAK